MSKPSCCSAEFLGKNAEKHLLAELLESSRARRSRARSPTDAGNVPAAAGAVGGGEDEGEGGDAASTSLSPKTVMNKPLARYDALQTELIHSSGSVWFRDRC